MEKILNEPIENLTGWQLQVRQAIEYSLGVASNGTLLKNSSYDFNIEQVYFDKEDEGTKIRCGLAHGTNQRLDLLLFVFEVEERQVEPLHDIPLRFIDVDTSKTSKNWLEEWSEALKQKTPIFTSKDEPFKKLNTVIKYGSVIVANM